ncbi:MAG: bifunctional methylenetetrahydrofolate dehydrogenase/methenyltetrahydrofolate cyclohydrolase, partial [Anaerolineales bacterium]|nr:bifunctional methylenetetrahydrofolate dehydrogenase/methenyltetrahydrofolate cyclohydrolase [Anaerolineales bacterium]
MSATIIDGKVISAKVKEEVRQAVAQMAAEHGYTPGLATVLVGEDTASATYVRSKKRTCQELGIRSIGHELPADISQEELLNLVQQLNADPEVNGILIQLPLPKHIDEETILMAIDIEKDVDGFHPVNVGRLSSGLPALVPCTPRGCVMLAKRAGAELSGMHAVIVGRSNIVGKPMVQLLLQQNCTVTVADSRTRDLPAICRQADLLVAAIGRPHFLGGDWIKPGAIVIDVGINRVPHATEPGKTRLVGDVA